jgi:hypothetical protein
MNPGPGQIKHPLRSLMDDGVKAPKVLWAMSICAVLFMSVSRAAPSQRDTADSHQRGTGAPSNRGGRSAAGPHRESLPADRTGGSGSTSRSAEPAGSHRAAAVTQQEIGRVSHGRANSVANSNTNRVRSLLDARARRRLAPRPSGRPAPQAQRTAQTSATAALAPTSSATRTAATAPTLSSPPANGGIIAVPDPAARGRAIASTPAVSRVAVRPATTVSGTSNTNAAARNSRVGGPYAGGHTSVGGPAIGRIGNAGKIDGTPLRRGF